MPIPIPIIPDYNSIVFSGCAFTMIENRHDRIYISDPVYELKVIPVMAVFGFKVEKEWGYMFNYPLIHKLQHLCPNGTIDYYSFHSLN